MANIKSTTGFPTSYGWSAYVTPKSRKGGSKSVFIVFLSKKSQRLIVSSAVNLVRRCHKHLMVGHMLVYMLVASTVEICIQQLGRVEEMV